MTLNEQEARESAAEHRYIEATNNGDPKRHFLCIDCGKELWLTHEDDSAPSDTGREQEHGEG